MKRMRMWSLVLVLVTLTVIGTLRAEDAGREQLIGAVIQNVLRQGHFRPQNFDDKLSVKAFGLYIQRLDYGKQFLLEPDINALKPSERQIDDDMRNGSFELLDKATKILQNRVNQVKQMYPELLAVPFDFDRDESIITDANKLDYCVTSLDLRQRWQSYLKYQTLLRYVSLVETEKRDQTIFHADLEKKAREAVSKNIGQYLDRVQKLTREDQLSRYLNAVINVFDPHTEYFPPMDRANFDIEFSGRLEGIGAQLREEDGYVKVSEIVPGSASWRQKELQPEDIILKVAQGGDEPVDVVGIPLDDAVKLIRGKKGTEVRLTVKKPDGLIKVIPIVRDVVVLEDTYARGAILQHSNYNRNFGYINLPKFYADFNNDGTPNAADDVRALLEHFKKQGVDGVVLDLRNNGGGSLDEAVKMAGLFIPSGPIVQVRDRTGNRNVLADPDPQIVYDGPLVILTNSLSASASEIVAAALQDYHRAVIVGASTTFGKGTVQRFFDLDQMVDDNYKNYKPLGSVKMTIQQFYRINGVSTQFNGVPSDVTLPDLYGYRDIGARNLEYSLPGDTIVPLAYEQWHAGDLPLVEINELSAKRTSALKSFRLITERANHLKIIQDAARQPLNWRKLEQQQVSLKKEADSLNAVAGDLPYLTVKSLESDDLNEIRKAALQDFYKGVKKDIYVDEAMSIINDMYSINGGVAIHRKNLK